MTTATPSLAITAPLAQLAVLEIAGPDAETFLQGQATAQLTHATDHFAPLGAFCTPKGRVIANVRILRPEETRYWLVLPASTLPLLEQHLNKYGVFYKATIQQREDLHVYGVQGDNAALHTTFGLSAPSSATGACQTQGNAVLVRVEGAARFMYVSATSPATDPMDTAEWWRQEINAGVAWVEASQSDAWLPQMLNWEALAGISFKKGCYTGQEVVARAHFRGQVKKRLMRLESEVFDDTASVPKTGDSVMDVEGDVPKAIGTVLAAQPSYDGTRWIMLAVVNQKEDMPGMEVNEVPVWDAGLPYEVTRLDPEQIIGQV